ncbi:polysaccharide biosynthesis tyrosine autokinase [Agrococcus terreus]|uniref:polysaccharide biosynthesis tyrosine autokinase n=1 Tax=Agrococcus terreus TaxID=574649 RepID=UPI00384DFD9A
MTLHEYGIALRRHWLVIAVVAVLGAVSGWGVSQLLPERFRAQATVMIIPARGDSTSELVQGSNYVQSLVQTYTILARSPFVLDPVIRDLGLGDTASQLANRTDVEAPLNTVVLTIGVTDADAEQARSIADAIADEFAIAVADASPEGERGEPAVRVSIIQPARAPSVPISPNTRMNAAMGGVAGLGLGVLAALGLRRFGGRIDDADDAREAIDEPFLGTVGRAPRAGVPRTLRERPSGRVAESLRQVTAALKFVDLEDERRVLLVTSAAAGEGKSSVSLGLALTLAELGHRVLAVEADLRRPTFADSTGLEGAAGLTSVLLGDATLADVAQPWGNERLHVLASGALPPNPGELLSSPRLRSIIDGARAHYDYVVVDTAPVLSVSDALWLAPAVDGAIVVARAHRTRRETLRRALEALGGTPAPVLGVVLNGVAQARSPYLDPDG